MAGPWAGGTVRSASVDFYAALPCHWRVARLLSAGNASRLGRRPVACLPGHRHTASGAGFRPAATTYRDQCNVASASWPADCIRSHCSRSECPGELSRAAISCRSNRAFSLALGQAVKDSLTATSPRRSLVRVGHQRSFATRARTQPWPAGETPLCGNELEAVRDRPGWRLTLGLTCGADRLRLPQRETASAETWRHFVMCASRNSKTRRVASSVAFLSYR